MDIREMILQHGRPMHLGIDASTTDNIYENINIKNNTMKVKNDTEDDDYDDYIDEDNEYINSDMLTYRAFIGEIPFDTILESIENQFIDFIDIEDNTNYVDVFYRQLKESYETAQEEDVHYEELKEALLSIEQQFIDKMINLFKTRLTISIVDEEGTDDNDELSVIFKTLYEFLILNGRNNFKTVIGKEISQKLGYIQEDSIFYNKIDELLMQYDPLIRCMGADTFIELCDNNESMKDIFDSMKVCGNFLRKYSAKLYKHEDFKVELISHITLLNDEMNHGRNSNNEENM